MQFGNTALLVASYKDHWKIVSTLLNAGVHINVKNMVSSVLSTLDYAGNCNSMFKSNVQ